MMDLKDLTFEETKEIAAMAEEKGFKYRKTLGEEKLKGELSEWLEQNPKALDEPKDNGNGNGDSGDKGSSKETVDIESDHRGEITVNSEKIDFGTDGKATVSSEAAKVLLTLKGYRKC
jgi:hypothetical protein